MLTVVLPTSVPSSYFLVPASAPFLSVFLSRYDWSRPRHGVAFNDSE